MEDKSAHSEKMPETIGRYQILEGIGFGAMGAVYKAFDPVIKRTLAIKTIRLDIPRQSPQYKAFIDRFHHEARISGTLSHPNIVTLFDIGEENGIPYLAMEFVDGQTVAARIEAGHRFKPEQVISLASQIAAALDYAHGKGVIHRDIKPSNLILSEDDRVKVTDFGIAKLADAEMTQSGTLLGTPSYMSPEQAMGDKLDGRSDIFSLGVCCFEMLAGEQPFPGTNVTSILYKLVHVDPIEPANLEMHGLVPQKWHEVFGRVLAKKPDDRYQTATAFVQDLEFCLGAWFGSVGTEETILAEEGEIARTISMPAMADDDLATVVLKAGPAASAPPPEEMLATVVMKAPPVEDASTVVMKAPPPRPPSASPPVSTADESATVVMKAPPVARVAPDGAGAVEEPPVTVVMKAPSEAAVASGAGSEPTVRVQLPQTVKMASPSAEETITVRVPPVAGVPPQAPRATKAAKPTPGPAKPTAAKPPVPPSPPPARGTPPVLPTAEALASTQPPTPAPVLPAEPRPGGPRSGIPPLIVLGGGALALVLGLVTTWLLLRPSRAVAPTPAPSQHVAVVASPAPEVPPPSTLAPVNMTLRVESTPPGAMVTVNGQSQGASPLEVTGLAAGDYEVRVELRGYEAKTAKVTLRAAEPRADLNVALTRSAPTSGTVDFLSTPFGAAVAVDGASVGPTPVLQHRLKPGPHQVEITKDGHEPWTGSVTVEAGKKAKVDATLRAIVVKATPPPAPAADTVDPDRVYNNVPSEVDTVARRTSGSSPVYPTDQLGKLKSGESASVVVSFLVTEDGEVTDAKVEASGGSKALDEVVLAAVRKWKYSPAVKRGVKVKVRIALKQTFQAG